MKPAPFEYRAPASLEEATETLARHGEAARVLAGGQSLVPMLNMRLVRPGVLVSLRRVSGLDHVSVEDGLTRVGSMTRQRVAEEHPAVREVCPLLAEALRFVAHPAIRAQGTIGGSVAHADPAAEVPAVLVALDGTVVLVSARGRRTVAARDFFCGLMRTAVEPGELVVELGFPHVGRPGLASGWGVEEVSRRHGDFAVAGVMVALAADSNRRVVDARIAVFGVEDRPTRRPAAEVAVQGTCCEPKVRAEAAELAVRDLEPLADLHASARFRAHLAGVLVPRALERAYRRLLGNG